MPVRSACMLAVLQLSGSVHLVEGARVWRQCLPYATGQYAQPAVRHDELDNVAHLRAGCQPLVGRAWVRHSGWARCMLLAVAMHAMTMHVS